MLLTYQNLLLKEIGLLLETGNLSSLALCIHSREDNPLQRIGGKNTVASTKELNFRNV